LASFGLLLIGLCVCSVGKRENGISSMLDRFLTQFQEPLIWTLAFFAFVMFATGIIKISLLLYKWVNKSKYDRY